MNIQETYRKEFLHAIDFPGFPWNFELSLDNLVVRDMFEEVFNSFVLKNTYNVTEEELINISIQYINYFKSEEYTRNTVNINFELFLTTITNSLAEFNFMLQMEEAKVKTLQQKLTRLKNANNLINPSQN